MEEVKMTACPYCGEVIAEGLLHETLDHGIILLSHGFVAQIFYTGHGNKSLPVEVRR